MSGWPSRHSIIYNFSNKSHSHFHKLLDVSVCTAANHGRVGWIQHTTEDNKIEFPVAAVLNITDKGLRTEIHGLSISIMVIQRNMKMFWTQIPRSSTIISLFKKQNGVHFILFINNLILYHSLSTAISDLGYECRLYFSGSVRIICHLVGYNFHKLKTKRQSVYILL